MAALTLFRRSTAGLLIAVCVLFSARLAAHDIPADAAVRMFVKPEGRVLKVLVRVQMASINDVDWPLHRDNGYLDLARVEPFLHDASTMWIADYLDVYEDDVKLAYPKLTSVRLSVEADTSFTTYEDALAHVTGPRLSEDTTLLSNQGQLDSFYEYAIQGDLSRFSIHPRFDRFGLRVLTILRFISPAGYIRAFEYEGGDPGLVRLDPSVSQAARKFAAIGWNDVLERSDLLLFLLCVAIPLRRVRQLIPALAAFIVAHSVTLIASAYGMAPDVSWFPPLTQTLIAASVVYMGVENIAAFTPERRQAIAFAFGLAYGFAFAVALQGRLQFAGAHVLTSVLAFNAGLEAAVLVFLAALLVALAMLFRFVISERMGVIVLSALAAHSAWHWMLDRLNLLSRFRFEWPAFTPAFFADVIRWLMIAVTLAGLYWLASTARKRDSGLGT